MIYVYVACTTFGLLYAIVSAVFGSHGFDHGGLHHGGIGAHHTGGDNADVPSPFNPLVIASAIVSFGAIGLITKLGFDLKDLLSAVIALASAGSIGALIFFGVVRFMYGSQSDSTYSINDLIGAEADVITDIPESGAGEIAYLVNGGRYNLPARSYNGVPIKKGEVVKIREISGNFACVTQKMSIEDFEIIERNKKQSNQTEN